MGKIIKIKGNVQRESSDGVFLLADEQCIFGIEDLYDETDSGTLEWFLKDEKGNNVFQKKGKWNDKLILTLNKKLCGDYRYQLTASYVNSKNKTITYPSIFIGGYCDPKIISAKTDLPQKAGCGKSFGTVTIEAEGLNGNLLSLEAEFADTCLIIKPVKCIEGKATFYISVDTSKFIAEVLMTKKDIEKVLKIKIKDSAGNYIKDNSGKDIILEKNITIEAFSFALPAFPMNNTITSISQPDKIETEVNGIIELKKIKIPNHVTHGFIVCNDFSTSDQWILPGNYHWVKGNSDKSKPDILPVTFPYTATFALEITIKCLLDIKDTITIRIQSDYANFKFDNEKKTNLSKDNEYTITFTNTITLTQIDYLKKCNFVVQYSFDNKSWIPLQTVSFEIYITKSAPVYAKLIPETLLFIGCKQCCGLKGTTSNEKIIDAIFTEFKGHKVYRRRENDNTRPNRNPYLPKTFPAGSKIEAMGYWRGESTAAKSFSGVGGRNQQNILLKYGEARCGEWTDFLIDILKVQGITNMQTEAICTKKFNNHYAARGYVGYTQTPKDFDNRYESVNFAVKNAKHIDTADHEKVSGMSPAQGTNDAQPTFVDHIFCYHPSLGRFYDASYGNSYSATDSNLQHYCQDSLNTIFLKPTFLGGSNKIEEKDIHKYIYAEKGKFK